MSDELEIDDKQKSQTLSAEFQNTENQINKIYETPSRKSIPLFNLSWSHYLKLMRIKDPNERKFYEIESFKNNWSLRELQLTETLPENLKSSLPSIDEIEKELSKSTEI